ncbi:ABC transporter ATP-binding protein [uncultured Cloacibacillus sp.]|uniref:ABC transporter ATP-binding protein n=1 Tax=uncultured Cloacibacillus sp. TaxID=889794 RepID=UPI00258A3FBA|nr:ABC transporter ATP-binding protein [uncultured Cloacibacillus sp.]
MAENKNILEIRNLHTSFFTHLGEVKAIRGIDIHIESGETLGIVGESGSGKSVTSLSIMRLLLHPGRVVDGEILFKGEDLLKKTEHEMTKIRGNNIAMIFQDPMTSLNPVLRVGFQIEEALLQHQRLTKKEAAEKAVEMLEMVGIPDAKRRAACYPHEFSGGMRQRAMIAMALSCRPELLIADEPTTALDVTIQAQIIRLIKELGQNTGTSTILITHDLGVVADICTRIDVMYAGLVMEEGKTDDVFFNPAHPYTMGLLRSIPNVATGARHRLIPIPGTPPDLLNPPQGCPFSPRCSFSMNICTSHRPGYYQVGEGHKAACWLLDKHAPCCDRYNAMKGGISSVER